MFHRKWTSLEEELAELEQQDPVVRAARDRLDQALWELTHRPLPKRHLKRLGGRTEPQQ